MVTVTTLSSGVVVAVPQATGEGEDEYGEGLPETTLAELQAAAPAATRPTSPNTLCIPVEAQIQRDVRQAGVQKEVGATVCATSGERIKMERK